MVTYPGIFSLFQSLSGYRALWAISITDWNFPHFSPCKAGGRKTRENSICCRNCSQGSCSYFDFPLVKFKITCFQLHKIFSLLKPESYGTRTVLIERRIRNLSTVYSSRIITRLRKKKRFLRPACREVLQDFIFREKHTTF